ncbi:MAG: polysaccharide deacetylase [Spirochaetes bacterium]|nr:polysaccharide deacetylase [Spirochaetota bacterium]
MINIDYIIFMKIDKIGIIFVFLCIFFAACSSLEPRPEKPFAFTAIAPKKEPGGRYAYLTFDDGPSPNTYRILNVLADYGIRGTFFFIGNEILEYENSAMLLRRMLAEGHYIGLHSMTHDFWHLYRAANAYQNFYNEMREVQKLIYDLTGGFRTNLYRPPFGTAGTFTASHISKMAESDLKCWDWNIDTRDWRLTSVDAILEKVKKDMRRENNPRIVVILFHELDITVEALPVVIEYFLELGYTFVPYHPDNHFPLNLLRNPYL